MIKTTYKNTKKITVLIVSKFCVKKMAILDKKYLNAALNVNGCGPSGFGYLIPDVNLKQDCNWHDFMYNTKAYGLASFALHRTKLSRFYAFFTGLFGDDRRHLNPLDHNVFNDMLRMVYIDNVYHSNDLTILTRICKILDMSLDDFRQQIKPIPLGSIQLTSN